MLRKRGGVNEFSTAKEIIWDAKGTGRSARAGFSDCSAGKRLPPSPVGSNRNAAKAEALCECNLFCRTIGSLLGCSFHLASRGDHFHACGACRGGEVGAVDTVLGDAVPAGSAWWVSPEKGGYIRRESIGPTEKVKGRGVRRRESGCEPQSCYLLCDLWHSILWASLASLQWHGKKCSD